MRKQIINTLVLFIISLSVTAQVPEPVKAQNQAIILKGGTAHIGNGTVIENSIIGFDKGKLTVVGDASTTYDDTYKVIDITGQHVFPGFILPNSQVGIVEVSSVRAMNDNDEVGDLAPNVRSLVAYNTDSKIIPTLRYNGILLAESTPTGGRISGTSSVMNMEGWNWEDAAMKKDVAIHMNWPRKMGRRFDFETFSRIREPNKEYGNQVAEVDHFMREAKAYGNMAVKERNLKLEGMQGLFNGSQILMIHASGSKEIVESVKMAQKYGVAKIVVIAGTETLDVAKFLADNNIPVVLPPIHKLPDSDDTDVYLPFKLPYLLKESGVTVALSHDGMLARARNLPFYAGSAVAYGLKKEEALEMITLNAAKVLGIEDEAGSLAKGKRASLFVSKGDPLDMMGNNLSYGFIDGKEIILDNEQQMLFKRYSEKYSQE